MSSRYLLLLLFGCAGILGYANARKCMLKEPLIYEEADYCTESQPHLGCNHNQKFGAHCQATARLLEIKPDLSKAIVRQMNVYRNIVAKGGLPNLPTAGRMNKLGWDESLAKLAGLAAMRCVLDPIKRSFTATHASKPGYTAILTKYPTSQKQTVHQIMYSHLKTFYNQHIHITPTSLLSGEGRNGRDVSHFLQLITGMNSRVGCGIVIFHEKEWTVQLMICLYGCNKHPNTFTYSIGQTPKISCACPDTDQEFKNLCPYNVVDEDCGLLNEEGLTTTPKPKPALDIIEYF
uniref:SCP domain-containing protein n=1 Tax=Drosophila arizonae TaxID=7263 RepID=A0A0B4UEB3_DROAR|nr:hypothetical protein [Drosophila arizonae]